MRYIISMILVNSMSTFNPVLQEPSLTDATSTQVDVRISATEGKLREILEENGININLVDDSERTSIIPLGADHPYSLHQQIRRGASSLFAGITLRKMEKIMASMQEQQIDIANIQDDRLKEFITLVQAFKIKSSFYFDMDGSLMNLGEASDETKREISEHLFAIESLFSKHKLDDFVESEIIINICLISLSSNNQPIQNIVANIESFFQDITPDKIMSIASRSLLEHINLQLYLLNRMSIDDFQKFIRHVSASHYISDELIQVMSVHLILQSSLINLNKNGDFKNFKELRVKLPGSLIKYIKCFHPDAKTEEKLLSLGIRDESYLNDDTLRKKIQIIERFPELIMKLNPYLQM